MRRPGSERPGARPRPRRWGLWALVAMAPVVTVGAWITIRAWTDWAMPAALPDPPNVADMPAPRVQIIREADAAARADAGSADAVGRLGQVYFANLDEDRAAVCFRYAADLGRDRWKWLYHTVLVMEDRSQTRAAIEVLQEVLRLRPDLALAWLRLGHAQFKAGNDATAEEALGKAAALDEALRAAAPAAPGDIPVAAHARLGLARLAFRRGDHERAVAILRPVLAAHADFGPAHRQLGLVYQEMGRQDESAAETKLADGLPPYVPPRDPIVEEIIDLSRSSSFLLKEVALAVRRGQMQRAEELARRAQACEPDDAMASYLLGKILLQTGRPGEALPLMKRQIDNTPESLTGLADCYKVLGRLGEAEGYYRRVLQMRPSDEQILSNLAGILVLQKRFDEAEELLRRAIRLNPISWELEANLAALLLARGGRATEAIECFRRALGHQPQRVDVRTALAAALQALGRSDEAVAELREALRYRPDYAPALANLLLTLIQGGRFEEAAHVGARLVAVMPREPMAHVKYASVLARLNRRDEALEHCRIALRLNPNLAEAKRLTAELAPGR